MAVVGGLGVIHRFMSIDEQCEAVKAVVTVVKASGRTAEYSPVAVAIGVNGDSQERATKVLASGANVVVIDVAHGHHINVKKMVEWLKARQDCYQFDIIGGSIATKEAAEDLQKWGVAGLRLSVGGGSICSTRIMTGCGVPTLQTVFDVAEVATVPIIADGGIRYPGDAAKALAAGADGVMIGSLFAGTDESPGEIFVAGNWPDIKHMKVYRGLASATTKLKYTGAASHVEGASKMVEMRGPVKNMISELLDGITSSMSYVGASNLVEFRARAKFIRITPNGTIEAHPHLLR
jgi:IMP dehydrogenase